MALRGRGGGCAAAWMAVRSDWLSGPSCDALMGVECSSARSSPDAASSLWLSRRGVEG